MQSREINYGGNKAYYSPNQDLVKLPIKADFKSIPEYYSTLFHELGHSTGHSKRLNRQGITSNNANFGNHLYSKEELIAEINSMFLCHYSNIETTFNNSIAYLKNWVTVLKSNPKWIIQASQNAQKSSDYIRNIKPEVYS